MGLKIVKKKRFRLIIDDCDSYSGTSVPFCFAVGSGTLDYNIGLYMDNEPQFSIVLQNGASYIGEQIIQKLTINNPNVKLSTFNIAYNTIKWHVEYYIESV